MTQERNDEIEVAEIRADIEETRVEMGGTLEQLGDRLEPSHLINDAKENVREATVGRVEETAKGMSDMLTDTIRQNPIPTAMAGAGLALLWMNRSHGNGNGHGRDRRYSDYYGTTTSYGQHRPMQRDDGQDLGSRARETAGEVGDNVSRAVGQATQNVGDTMGQVGHNVGSTVGDVGSQLDRFMQASPLAMGAIALGAGAVIGALVPETRQEREMLGDASRQVTGTVREKVDQAADQAEQKVDEAEASMSASR